MFIIGNASLDMQGDLIECMIATETTSMETNETIHVGGG